MLLQISDSLKDLAMKNGEEGGKNTSSKQTDCKISPSKIRPPHRRRRLGAGMTYTKGFFVVDSERTTPGEGPGALRDGNT